MKLRGYKTAIFFLVFLALLSRGSGYGQEKEAITTTELQEVVDLIEDPNKRAILVKTLKNLIQAQEAAMGKDESPSAKPPEKKKRELLIIEQFFSRFESLSTKVLEAAAGTASLVSKTSLAYEKIKHFLSKSENRANLLKLLADVAGAILVALLLRFLIQKCVPKTTGDEKSLARNIVGNAVQVLLALIPYGALLVFLFVLFRLFPSFPLGHSLSLVFFTILLFYQAALRIFRALLSPDAESTRILRISDETANYYWIWVQRFAHYTAVYFLVTQTLIVAQVAPQSVAFIRGILLLVFPLMIGVLIMQVAREIRLKYDTTRKEERDKTVLESWFQRIPKPVIRYWPVIAIAYSWAIFLFKLINYEMGSSYLLTATFYTALTLLALALALRVEAWSFEKFFAINKKIKERFPGLEEKTNRYLLVFKKAVKAVLAIMAIGVIAQVWGIPVAMFVASKTGAVIILRAIAIVITLGAVFLVIETSQLISDYLLREERNGNKPVTQKMKTLVPIVRTSVKIAAGFVGGIVILDRLGVNTTPILAGAGIVGLAVGFGSQTLVKDLINGLFILFEESIRVGDYTDLGKNQGTVETVGLRTVKLRDVHGNFHVVPNSSIDTITNMSKEFSRVVIDVGVAYREDVDQVMDILREIGEGMRNDPDYAEIILEPMEVFGLQSFDDSAVVIRIRFTTAPLKQWGLKREFNRRMKRVFDERGIEIPFPHRTIYMGEPKRGAAPALNVQLTK